MDELGTLDDAIVEAKKQAGMPEGKDVEIPRGAQGARPARDVDGLEGRLEDE